MRTHYVVVGRTEVSRATRSTKRGQLSGSILGNQLSKGGLGRILMMQGKSTSQCFELTFRRTAGGRLSKSVASIVRIGALIFISGVIPAVQHDTRLSAGCEEEDSSDEEEQS